jgi:asparagine synthase (glutamine-hydrolysing)
MCGIAGIISMSDSVLLTELKGMTDVIIHRGPDGEGHWINDSCNVGLGHRRLSIIDLSECGSQPMEVGDRYVIVFNGEIYNYIELRKHLLTKGYHFKSESDTEVLVQMYDAFGEKCLQHFDGMFAFVIFDKKKNIVFGARDRFGEKPFFYHIAPDRSMSFASEIKALWSIGVSRQMEESFLFNYLAFGYVQDPCHAYKTFYKDIFKLPAASYFYYDLNISSLKIDKYWDIQPGKTATNISEQDAAKKLNELLSSSVERRLRSDVPIGSSLSGGLDSSIIVSLLDQLDVDKKMKRKTFSASFPGFRKDETVYQKIIIENTSVDPYFVYPNEDSFFRNFEKIAYHQDEPFNSASINIQYEVFRKAKEQNTTVLLDGQGADEIFAGYHGYFYAYFDELKRTDKSKFRSEYEQYRQLHEDNTINQRIELHRFDAVRSMVPEGIKRVANRHLVKLPVARKIFSRSFYEENHRWFFAPKEHFSTLNESLYYSLFKMGLEELLRYADRNSMAHSLEVRLPFLNHELVEFIFTLPAGFKIREGWTKWILRKVYSSMIDDRIIWRKDKIGYEPPQNRWMEHREFKDKMEKGIQALSDHKILNDQFGSGTVNGNLSLAWKMAMMGNYLD